MSSSHQRTGRTVAFLSLGNTEGWCIYDDLLVEPLKERGWNVLSPRLDWHQWKSIDWSSTYDVVVIRSTWDYQDDLDEFHRALDHIQNHHLLEESKSKNNKPAALMNDLELVKWNSRKDYLRDLDMKGKCVINPSVFLNDRRYFAHLLSTVDQNNSTKPITRSEFDLIVEKSLEIFPEILFKPIVGASSFGIARITREEYVESKKNQEYHFQEDPEVVKLRDGKMTYFGEDMPELKDLIKRDAEDKTKVIFKSKLDFVWCVVRSGKDDYIIQPFLQTIQTHGEWGLFFFNTKLSHAMRKVPKKDDFRVQEEYGAKHQALPISELDPKLIAAAQQTFAGFPTNSTQPLYARVDLVPLQKEIAKKCLKKNWGYCCVGACSGGGDQEEKKKQLFDEDQEGNDEFLWSVMEVELVEPSLYFDLCKDGIKNFCDEFSRRFE